MKHLKGMENQVADALSGNVYCIYEVQISQVHSNIPEIIKEASLKDPEYISLWKKVKEDQMKREILDFKINSVKTLTFKYRIYVPNQTSLKQLILDESHRKPCAGHVGYHKLLSAIRYFWLDLRKDATEYLSKCLECQLVKAKHQHLVGFLQPLPIPEWKWETISLDFITDLPHTKKQHDSIMVVVEKLSKTTHFIPMKSTYKTC